MDMKWVSLAFITFLTMSSISHAISITTLPPESFCRYHNLTQYYEDVASSALSDFPGAEVNISNECHCNDSVRCDVAVSLIEGVLNMKQTYTYRVLLFMDANGTYYVEPKVFGTLEKIRGIIEGIEAKEMIDYLPCGAKSHSQITFTSQHGTDYTGMVKYDLGLGGINYFMYEYYENGTISLNRGGMNGCNDEASCAAFLRLNCTAYNIIESNWYIAVIIIVVLAFYIFVIRRRRI